ncbi:HzsA-related protein [Pontiella sulfatireligans]|nr:hypothetical protein [Pontiella sulfatireligans]
MNRLIWCRTLQFSLLIAAPIFSVQAEVPSRTDVVKAVCASGGKKVVFAARKHSTNHHWYANFGYYATDAEKKYYLHGGALCVVDLETGKLTKLIETETGTLRDPKIHYDGEKMIFSWRKGGEDAFHLYEMKLDGSDLKQLTDGIYSDIEPTYLPDGGIAFISSRSRRWVNCFGSQVATLFRCDADGTNMRELSANVEQDNTPWMLPDGRLMFTRWEYVDRSQMKFHHLWTVNPDGTQTQILFGNMHPNNVFIDAKPVPGTHEILLVRSPKHGQTDHTGAIALLDPMNGPDDLQSLRDVSRTIKAVNKKGKTIEKNMGYCDPFPLTSDLFLAANGRNLIALDREGNETVLFSLPDEFDSELVLYEPRPVKAYQRETRMPDRINLAKNTGTLILNSAHVGRNMKGVKKGDIRKLLVLETLPKPINYGGNIWDHIPVTPRGSYTIERILGTVPVEADGSAHFEVPANRPMVFVALDENDVTVKRMHSFLSVAPGEVLSCVGCHEERNKTPDNLNQSLQALTRPATPITPIEGIPEIIDYARDIQPIWDRHCASCHNPDKLAGDLDLSSDYGTVFFNSYINLDEKRLVSHHRNGVGNTPPRSVGDVASPIFEKFDGSHHDAELSPEEVNLVRHWVHVGIPQVGTYGSFGVGMIPCRSDKDLTERQRSSLEKAAEILEANCAACHGKKKLPPIDLVSADGRPRGRIVYSLYNLTQPEKSRILMKALAKEAGGHAGTVKMKGGKTVDHAFFKSTEDPNYQVLLQTIRDAHDYILTNPRWHMEGFKPSVEYVREMKRYGMIPETYDNAKDPIDVFDVDRRYFEASWYYPEGRPAPPYENKTFSESINSAPDVCEGMDVTGGKIKPASKNTCY